MDSSGPRVSGNRRLSGVGAVGVLLAAVALLASGCGGDKQPSKAVASVAATGSSTPSAAPSSNGNPVAYAQCMRANGVPDFPDPDKDGAVKLDGGGRSGGIDPNSPAFKNADEKCEQYRPTQTGSQSEQDSWSQDSKLKYAQCMRENGLPTFPDPGQNGLFPEIGAKGSALNPGSAQFKQAEKACAQYKPQGTNGGAPGGGS